MRTKIGFYLGKEQLKVVEFPEFDTAHKVVGMITYGGYLHDKKKLIMDEYMISHIENGYAEVVVVLHTQEDADRKLEEQLAAQFKNKLTPDFTNKLVPPFQRKTKDELN